MGRSVVEASNAVAEKPPIAAAAITISLDSTFIRSREASERHLEVRVGNVETVDGGRQVFGAVTRAETDLTALMQRTLATVGRTDTTKVTAFTDGCPGLRTVLADAGVTEPPSLDWFHIAMRLQHTKLAAANLPTNEPERVTAKAVIAAIAPRKTYMMLHQFDAALVAAAQPAFTGQLVFLHNCDHSLSLGVHIQHAVHADFHRKGFFRCRVERASPGYQIAPGYMIPMTAEDIGTRRGGRFMQRGHLTTCTTGGIEKFSNMHYLERRPYLYQYPKMVSLTLAASRGTHIHIGPLPDEMITQIRGDVASLGLPENRFVHIRNVPSVWQAFLDEAVDVFLGSIPYGGGRATVEAMGAGLPLVIHSNYSSEFLCVECEVYRDAMIWRNFDQFRQHVGRLDPAILERHSALSRAYYEDFHAPRWLEEALARIDRGLPQPEPEPLAWRGDLLQNFIDEALPGIQRTETDETVAVLALGKRCQPDLQG